MSLTILQMHLASSEHSVNSRLPIIVMLPYAWSFPTKDWTAWSIKDQGLGTCVLISATPAIIMIWSIVIHLLTSLWCGKRKKNQFFPFKCNFDETVK